jgi:hypothetical protein
MSAGDFVLQMPPNPRSRLEAITGESDTHESQRRGGITRLTVDIPSARRTQGETRPSRWRTPEFLLYSAIIITAVSWMTYVPIQLSSSAYYFIVFSWACRPYLFFSETHPNYDLYRHRLADGWLPGTQIVSSASLSLLGPSCRAPSLYATTPPLMIAYTSANTWSF